MSILDGILGDTSLDLAFGADPSLGLGLSDVLDFSTGEGDSTQLTGIGEASLDASVPIAVGLSASTDSGDGDDGGLLGGLL